MNRPATRISPTHSANGNRYGLVSVDRATSGVAPATANSVDSSSRPLDDAAPSRPPGWIGPAAASPGINGMAPTSAQRAMPEPDDDSVRARAMPTRIAPTVHAAVTWVTSRRSSGSTIRSRIPSASGTIASASRTPLRAMSGGDQVASSGRRMNGVAVATESGTANGCTLAPARPLASHQPAMNRIAVPRKTAGIVSRRANPPSRLNCVVAQPAAAEPCSSAHGSIASRSVIGAASSCDLTGAVSVTTVGVAGSTPIGCGAAASPVWGSGVGGIAG